MQTSAVTLATFLLLALHCMASPVPQSISTETPEVIEFNDISSADIPFDFSRHKRQTSQLGLYVCANALWQGPCSHAIWHVPQTNVGSLCIDMPGQIEAFGPDYCTQCDTYTYVKGDFDVKSPLTSL